MAIEYVGALRLDLDDTALGWDHGKISEKNKVRPGKEPVPFCSRTSQCKDENRYGLTDTGEHLANLREGGFSGITVLCCLYYRR